MILAAINGHSEIVDVLVTAGADVNHTNKVLLPCSVLTHEAQDGNTVSILSAVNGHSEIVDELMTVGADVNHVKKVCLFGIVSPKESQNGNKTFILDAYQGLIEVVKFLLESGWTCPKWTRGILNRMEKLRWNMPKNRSTKVS